MKNIIKNTNKKGFTIVELVIVIAVIAILAGVLIPTFAGIIEKANESAAKQEALNNYKEFYALDLSDGLLDGKKADKVTDIDSNYSVDDAKQAIYNYTNSKGYKVTITNGVAGTVTKDTASATE